MADDDLPLEAEDMRATASGANSHVSSPIINLNLGDGVGRAMVRWLLGFIGGAVGIVLVTVVVAYKGQQQADFANQNEQTFERRIDQDFSAVKTEAREWQYWAERAEIAAEKQGIKLPPLPKH